MEKKKATRKVMGRIADFLRRMARHPGCQARISMRPRLSYRSLTHVGLVAQDRWRLHSLAYRGNRRRERLTMIKACFESEKKHAVQS